MSPAREILTALTSPDREDTDSVLLQFAEEFGWRVTDAFRVPYLDGWTSGHILVEEAMDIRAVISFLTRPHRYETLQGDRKHLLAELAYNSLVDWRIHIQSDAAFFLYNRTVQPRIIQHTSLVDGGLSELRRDSFDVITGKAPAPNLPALDDALVRTLEFWKRQISAELSGEVGLQQISALFNAIILIRASEDHFEKWSPAPEWATPTSLLDEFRSLDTPTLAEAISRSQGTVLAIADPPEDMVDTEALAVFNALDPTTGQALLSDFYRNRFVSQFRYDFSLISKHALSKIYESYVTKLRFTSGTQATLFPQLPEVEHEKTFGSVYTPPYIARFFSRYLQRHSTPHALAEMSSLDPSCGSGIFLRTLLEVQAEQVALLGDQNSISILFSKVAGWDIDPNAVEAARLSLNLLHLVLLDRFPTEIDFATTEAIQNFRSHPELRDRYEAILANPPFVSFDNQSEELRRLVQGYLGEHATGRPDVYLAFLKLAIEALKPGGRALFVVPHSFALTNSASGIRQLLAQQCDIEFFADLTSIPVFGDTGVYVALLIFRKRRDANEAHTRATVLKCDAFVGQALEEALKERWCETDFFLIYPATQDAFTKDPWVLLPPTEHRLRDELSELQILSHFFSVRQGVVTGDDDVFIVPKENVPEGEESVYAPYLSDRQMMAYNVPQDTPERLFYPVRRGKRLTQDELEHGFPRTWEYLLEHKPSLCARGSLDRYGKEWWEPMWMRERAPLLQPKLVTPQLFLLPRFSYDREGRYAVGRTPFLFPRAKGVVDDLLLFGLAVLNSSISSWFLVSNSKKFSRGYVALENRVLNRLPMPDPAAVSNELMRRLLALTEKRLASGEAREMADVENELDSLVLEAYDLSPDSRSFFTERS